jgi:hypothetical protein
MDGEFSVADHIRVGFNTGMLDVFSTLFFCLAQATGNEPLAYSDVLTAQLEMIRRAGGNENYVSARLMPMTALRDVLVSKTLEQRFTVIRGGLEELGGDQRAEDEQAKNTDDSAPN